MSQVFYSVGVANNMGEIYYDAPLSPENALTVAEAMMGEFGAENVYLLPTSKKPRKNRKLSFREGAYGKRVAEYENRRWHNHLSFQQQSRAANIEKYAALVAAGLPIFN